MSEYTIEAIAVKTSHSARQVQRWISSGKLRARRIEGTNRFEVADEALVPFLPHETTDDLLDRLEALELKISRLEAKNLDIHLDHIKASESNYNAILDRLGAIEDRLRVVEENHQKKEPRTLQPVRPIYAAGKSMTASTPGTLPDDMPAGSLLHSDFAKRHGVPESTFKGHLNKDLVPCTVRPKPGRPRETERWLTPSQQQEAIDFWQRNGTPYQPCDACPHDV